MLQTKYENIDDNDEENVNGLVKEVGYCHFNDNNNKEFNINLMGHDVVIQQDPTNNEGHGFVVWDAGVVFVKYMENNPKDFTSSVLSNKTMIDLGSGTGIGGIAFMLRGSKVTCTDLKNVIEKITELNTSLIYKQIISKGSGSTASTLHKPTVFPIDWTSSSEEHRAVLKPPYDYILLTDCVFSVTLAPYLVETIRRCSNYKSVVYICHEIRDIESNELFLKLLSKYYKLKRISTSKLHCDYRNDLIELIVAKEMRSKKEDINEI